MMQAIRAVALGVLSLLILVSRSEASTAGSDTADPARRWVETAVARMGGHAIFDAVERLQFDEDGLQYHVMDAEHPVAPFSPDVFHGSEQIDYQLPAMRRKVPTGSDPLYANSLDMVFTPSGVTAVNQRAGKMVPRRTPASRHWLLQDPVAVLRAALAAPDLRADTAAVVIQDIRQNSATFHQGNTRVRLFFNPWSGNLSGSEIVTTETWEVIWDLADVRLKTLYGGWELEAGGFHFPTQWDVFFDDLPFQSHFIANVLVNPTWPAATFEPLADATVALASNVDDLAPGPPARPWVEVAAGIVQVTPGPSPGNFSTLLVDQGDGVVVIEAPCSSGWSVKILEEAEHRYPGKPIKGVITTDSTWWHFAGLREFAARGIPIYVMDQNVAIVSSLLAAPRTLNPDALQRQPREANFINVSAPLSVGAGINRIVLYPMRASTNQVMMVYLPGVRVLYSADMAGTRGPGGPFVNAENIWELKSEVDQYALPIDILVGIHLLPTAWVRLTDQVRAVVGASTP